MRETVAETLNIAISSFVGLPQLPEPGTVAACAAAPATPSVAAAQKLPNR
jgi:hypothetical protein